MSTCNELIAKNDYKNLDVRLVDFETRKRLIAENINKFAEKLLWQNGDYYVYVFNCKANAYTPWHDTGEHRGPLQNLWNVAFIFEGTNGGVVRVVCIYGGRNFYLTPNNERSQLKDVNDALANAAQNYGCTANKCRYILFNTRLLRNYTLRIFRTTNNTSTNSNNTSKDSIRTFYKLIVDSVNKATSDYTSKVNFDTWSAGSGDSTGRDRCSNYIGARFPSINTSSLTQFNGELGPYPNGMWNSIHILSLEGTTRVKYTNTIGDKEGFCFESLREKLTPLQIVLLIIAIILFFVMVFIIARNNCCSQRCYFGKS